VGAVIFMYVACVLTEVTSGGWARTPWLGVCSPDARRVFCVCRREVGKRCLSSSSVAYIIQHNANATDALEPALATAREIRAVALGYPSTGSMGARRIFSRGGQIRGLETKVRQQGPGVEPR